MAVWQNYDNSPELEELGKAVEDGVKQWRQELLDFQAKYYNKYDTSLGVAGSGNRLKNTLKKLVFLREKEEIQEMWRKLHTFSDILVHLSLAAQT